MPERKEETGFRWERDDMEILIIYPDIRTNISFIFQKTD